MSTLARTPTGDLDLSSGNLRVVRDPAEEIAIRLTDRFRLHRGEWTYDVTQGVPYLELIWGQREEAIPLVVSLVRRIILETPGVLEIDDISSTFDGAARRLAVGVSVRVQTGELIAGQVGGTFVVLEG